MLPVPEHIEKPEYHITGAPGISRKQPEIKSEKQINLLKNACKLAANILQVTGRMLEVRILRVGTFRASFLCCFLKVNMTTNDIDEFVHKSIINKGAYPSPLNYRHFPKSVCTSVNNIACHGIPDDRPLQDGDIINIDITVYLNGYHGDCSRTFLIGNVDEKGRELVKVTEECLMAGIKECRNGIPFAQIGKVIERLSKERGYQVVPAFCGHGIGTYFHGPPEIMHIGKLTRVE